jgi:hypothetical protein
MNRARRALPALLGCGFTGLVILVWLLLIYHSPSAATPDIRASFIGLTNNPGPSAYPALSVLPGSQRPYCIFGITNVSKSDPVTFGISAFEILSDETWKPQYEGDLNWQAMGQLWLPGYGTLYAVPWPSGVPRDIPWRLRLWVVREPKLIALRANQRLGTNIFKPHDRHMETSDAVVPNVL